MLIMEDKSLWRIVEQSSAPDPKFRLHHVKILDSLSKLYSYRWKLTLLTDRQSGFNLDLELPDGRTVRPRRMITETYTGIIAAGTVGTFRLFGGDVKSSTIEVSLEGSIPDRLEPYNSVTVQLLSNLEPFATGAKFDTAIWDRDSFAQERVLQHEYWRDITGPIRKITLSKGPTSKNAILEAEPGYLEIEATSEIDPRYNAFAQGAQIRVINNFSGVVLWHGWLFSAYSESTPKAIVTRLKAVDAIGIIASRTRYGTVVENKDAIERFSARINRLSKSISEVKFLVPGNEFTGTPASSIWETSLSKHIDAACWSARAYWRQTQGAEIEFLRLSSIPGGEVIFSDSLNDGAPNKTLYASLMQGKWSSETELLAVECNVHQLRPETGSAGKVLQEADDRTYIAYKPGNAPTYRGRTVKVDTFIPPDIGDGLAMMNFLWGLQPIIPGPSEIVVPVLYPESPRANLEYLNVVCDLKPLMGADAIYDGTVYSSWVGRISHSITPYKWIANVELIPIRR